MKPYKIGLVIGKFYPLHNGHNYLIDTAFSLVDTLIIIICQRPGESPNGDQRFFWMREIYKSERIKIKLIDDYFDGDDSLLWAEMTLAWCKPIINGQNIDVVCTSEKYGDNYCKYLGLLGGRRVVHHLVDLKRENVPISGTKIRSQPKESLHFLKKEVRRFYYKKMVICGEDDEETEDIIDSFWNEKKIGGKSIFLNYFKHFENDEEITEAKALEYSNEIERNEALMADIAYHHKEKIMIMNLDFEMFEFLAEFSGKKKVNWPKIKKLQSIYKTKKQYYFWLGDQMSPNPLKNKEWHYIDGTRQEKINKIKEILKKHD